MGKFQLSQATTKQSQTTMKACMFYIGTLLNVLGIFFFFLGATSDSWIIMSAGGSDVPPNKRLKFVSNYGPWSACTHGHRCDHPWLILGGVDKMTSLVVQFLFGLGGAAYLLVYAVMVIQNLPASLRRRCKVAENQLIVEFAVPIAAILAFFSMLMMGQLKREVIGHEKQTESTGPGFVITLCAILLTVAGSVCTIFYRHDTGYSRMALYIKRLRRRRKNLTLNGRRRWRRHNSKQQVGVSDVEIFTVDASDIDGAAGDRADDEAIPEKDTGNELNAESDIQVTVHGVLASREGNQSKTLGKGESLGRIGDSNLDATKSHRKSDPGEENRVSIDTENVDAIINNFL